MGTDWAGEMERKPRRLHNSIADTASLFVFTSCLRMGLINPARTQRARQRVMLATPVFGFVSDHADPSHLSLSFSPHQTTTCSTLSTKSIFYSYHHNFRSKPLKIWAKQVKNGHIKRITDQDIQSSVLEIVGTNVSTTYVTCPNKKKDTLGIKLPFLVMIIKNVSSCCDAGVGGWKGEVR